MRAHNSSSVVESKGEILFSESNASAMSSEMAWLTSGVNEKALATPTAF
jgi:hypothetical protein